MYKKLTCLGMLLLLLSVVTVPAYAYKPSPFFVIRCNQNDIPKGTAYIDLLLPIQEDDERFSENEKETESVINILDYSIVEISNTSEIANYNDGYCSYLFHFEDSVIFPNQRTGEDIFIEYGSTQNLLDELVRLKNCKLAFVGAEGSILTISDEFMLKDSYFKDFEYLMVQETAVTAIYNTNPYRIAYMMVLSLSIMVIFTVIVVILYRKRKGKN